MSEYIRNEHNRLCLRRGASELVELIDGPWHAEADRFDLRHEGFPLLALRGPHGAWCGYIALPPDHPWLRQAPKGLPVEFTYGGRCNGEICHVPEPGEPDDVFWLGFDNAHSAGADGVGDMTLKRAVPGEREDFVRFCRGMGWEPPPPPREVYRTLEFCQSQLRTVAERARGDAQKEAA